jgi:hypothetical protein
MRKQQYRRDFRACLSVEDRLAVDRESAVAHLQVAPVAHRHFSDLLIFQMFNRSWSNAITRYAFRLRSTPIGLPRRLCGDPAVDFFYLPARFCGM